MPHPAVTEYAPFYAGYVARVPETDPLPALEAQPAELLAIADRIAPEDELFRYAPDKWSVRQMFGLPGFSENDYVAGDDSNHRPVKALAHEFAAVRHANLWAIRRWSDDQWSATGNANGLAVSARAIAYIMVGHVRHHIALLRERYGLEA
jgi:hypothetical protein